MEKEIRLETLRREFARLQRLADGAMAQLDDEAFFRVPAADGNSVAILVKHVAGNQLSRWTDFLTSDGEKPERNRDSEFVIAGGEDRARLLERWERGWAALFAALDGLTEADLDRTVTIRGEPHGVDQAIHRQLTHYAYHVGQIVHAARAELGERWETLSIARGETERFNADPAPYLDPDEGA